MTDPRIPLQAACITAIQAALTTAGYTADSVFVDPQHADAFPYILVGQTTMTDFSTKDVRGAECTVQFVAWDDDWKDAADIGSVALNALTDWCDPVSVTDWTLAGAHLDFAGDVLREEDPPKTYWGHPYRVRFRLMEAIPI